MDPQEGMEQKVQASSGYEYDCWGYPVNTRSASCLAAVESYYGDVLSYGRRRAVILEAPLEDPSCALANVLAAYYLSTQNPQKASSLLAAAASALDTATPYERAVFRSVSCLMGDDRDEDEALDRHFKLLKEYPKDLASLKRAQVMCFYMGRPDLSLDLVEQVLPQNHDQSYIYGMLAFPLLELGRMGEAERAARKGFDINKHDLWSQHALCHVFQYECRFKEAVDFMEACSSSWKSCSSFIYTHNWWHVAVCYLESHASLDKVLEVYDHYIWKELQRNDSEHGEVYINALGLLLLIYVRGHMNLIKDRLMILANIFKDEATWHREWLLDLLGLWALTSCNETREAEDLLKCMKSRFYLMSSKKQHLKKRGIQLAEAIYEYGRGNYHKVFDILGPKFDAIDCKMIGASDEQLDVFNEVWYNILLNTGHVSEAIEVIEKQVKKRKGPPYLWRLLEKAYSMEGRPDASGEAKRAFSMETEI